MATVFATLIVVAPRHNVGRSLSDALITAWARVHLGGLELFHHLPLAIGVTLYGSKAAQLNFARLFVVAPAITSPHG